MYLSLSQSLNCFHIAVDERIIDTPMTDEDMSVVRDIASLLRPFRATLTAMQASKTAVISRVYGMICSLMTQMSESKV